MCINHVFVVVVVIFVLLLQLLQMTSNKNWCVRFFEHEYALDVRNKSFVNICIKVQSNMIWVHFRKIKTYDNICDSNSRFNLFNENNSQRRKKDSNYCKLNGETINICICHVYQSTEIVLVAIYANMENVSTKKSFSIIAPFQLQHTNRF